MPTRLLLASMACLVALHQPASGQQVGKSGKTTPPGCAAEIEWRVVAQKVAIPPGGAGAGKTVTVWADFTNRSDFDCKFVFCFMLDLKKNDVPNTPSFTIGKNANNTTWFCRRSGATSAPPNFSFGCVQVTVPAHAGIVSLSRGPRKSPAARFQGG